MKRREFIALGCAVVAALPVRANAQQRFKIGLLEAGADNRFFTEHSFASWRNWVMSRAKILLSKGAPPREIHSA